MKLLWKTKRKKSSLEWFEKIVWHQCFVRMEFWENLFFMKFSDYSFNFMLSYIFKGFFSSCLCDTNVKIIDLNVTFLHQHVPSPPHLEFFNGIPIFGNLEVCAFKNQNIRVCAMIGAEHKLKEVENFKNLDFLWGSYPKDWESCYISLIFNLFGVCAGGIQISRVCAAIVTEHKLKKNSIFVKFVFLFGSYP